MAQRETYSKQVRIPIWEGDKVVSHVCVCFTPAEHSSLKARAARDGVTMGQYLVLRSREAMPCDDPSTGGRV